jgi:hypothetical protein
MKVVVASVSPVVEEDPVKTDWKSSPAKCLLRLGFFGLRTVSRSPPEVKEASSSTLADKEDSSMFSLKTDPLIA